jgi:lipopolysaccharide export system permease protein
MIIERYIHQEIFRYLLWITGLLFLIMAAHRFVRYLADAAAGKISGELVLNMVGLKLMATLPIMLPVALYLAVLLAFSRLLRDSELTIISSAGMGQRFQMRVAARFTLVFALPLAAVVFHLAPWAEATMQVLQEQARQEADIAGINPGQFREFSDGKRVVYAEDMTDDGSGMSNVFLQIRQGDRLGILSSDRAYYESSAETNSRYVVFEDGRRYVAKPGEMDYEITEYEHYSVMVLRRAGRPAALRLEALPTLELLQSDRPMHRAEWQWRLSVLISSFLLALLAVLLNRLFIQQKQYMSVFIAILIYFVYSNLLGISKTFLMRESIPAWIGLWWVHLLVVVIILALLYLPFFRNWRLRTGGNTPGI